MFKKIFTAFQNIIPQHLLSETMGALADSRNPKIKNLMIRQFMKRYNISLNEAVIEDPTLYKTFNDFFIRKLKPTARPIVSGDKNLACPVDGTITQIGKIDDNLLLQAKDFYFDLESLLGNDQALANDFYNGEFSTLYLAPVNYHRVHMPLTGKLLKTIYIPGKLFSVNHITSNFVPKLYSRNERLVCIFETSAGLMSVILIGAIIVGSIKPVWKDAPVRAKKIEIEHFNNGQLLNKGDEIGYFQLGSSVILLFQKNRIRWDSELLPQKCVKVGQKFGEIFLIN